MKISTSSWHYRLNKFMDGKHMAGSVCGYFWQTVASLVRVVITTGMLGFLGFFVLSPLLSLGAPLVVSEGAASDYSSLAYYMTYFDGIVLGLIGFCFLYNKSSFLQVIGAYIKAVKNKMCPLVEFVDKDAA